LQEEDAMETKTVNSYSFSVLFVKDYTCPVEKVTFKAGYEYHHTSIRLHRQLQNGTGELCHTTIVQTYPIESWVKVPREYYKLFRRDYAEVTTTTVTVTEE
jgi:hypothetical protein